MSIPEQDHEDVGATVSSSEPDDEPERSVTSPESDAASGTTRSSIEQDEAEGSTSSGQSSDSTLQETNPNSRREIVDNVLHKVDKLFSEICLEDDKFKKAAESYLNRVIDFLTLGVAFEVYREAKMGSYGTVVHMEQLAEVKSNKIRTDIFAEYYDKERKCVCSKCTKMVLASGFAVHLEVCMGIKQSRTRRRVVTATSSRDRDSPTYESLPSSDEDNDDDADWSCGGEKRKKKRERNGSKRIKGTTKKTEIESTEIMEVEEVDIEGGADDIVFEEEDADDDIFSLSEFFVDDSSQSYVTASSTGTISNTSSDEVETKIQQSSPSPTSSS